MAHILRLREIPLGPQNAFIKCVMATCDHPSDLVHRIAYPSLGRPGLRTDWRSAAWPAEGEKELPLRTNRQEKEAGDIFYLIEARPRNPWAAIGSVACLSLLLMSAIVIPLFHTDPLPKREMLTMLYLQPPAAAGNATQLRAPAPSSTYTPRNIAISTPVHKTQEAPPPPISTTGGVLGGVSG